MAGVERDAGGEGAIPALLGVFAHPDDEAIGTNGALCKLAARGVAVHLLVATSGDAGQISDPALATPATLGAVREEELRAACRLLGFREPIFLRYPDGKLAGVAPERLVGQIVGAIRRLRPRVVLTFDANGGYGHPDHIAIHRATLAAWRAAPDPAVVVADEDGRPVPPHRPDKLYATAYPRSLFWRLSEALAAAGIAGIDFGAVQTIDAADIGTADERITTAVPVADVYERRWAGVLAHRTQYGPGSPFVAMPEALRREWLSADRFVRLDPAPAPGTPLPDESELWAGLPSP